MIAGIFHEGSGLGDQLFRYITVRTLAEEKRWEFTMIGMENFKGKEFMPHVTHKRDYPKSFLDACTLWNEKDVRDVHGNDIRSYDPEFNFVKDFTILDGSFEDSKYWHHNLPNISKWLAVEPLHVRPDTCIVGFRGGEYYLDPNLGLPKEYFDNAHFAMMVFSDKHLNLKLQVHTDDPRLATTFFPTAEIIDNQPISHSKHTNMAFNWRSTRYAKYAIIPNSAFFILPRLLKHLEDPTAVTIAPRWWSRRNTKGPWRPAAYYKEFTYI